MAICAVVKQISLIQYNAKQKRKCKMSVTSYDFNKLHTNSIFHWSSLQCCITYNSWQMYATAKYKHNTYGLLDCALVGFRKVSVNSFVKQYISTASKPPRKV